MPELKPPTAGNGTDMHGPYITLIGEEGLAPLTVRPSSTANSTTPTNYTKPGSALLVLPIAKSFFSNTRLRLLMENYTRVKFMKLAIRFQALGDATLGGAVIAVPITDPSVNLTLGGTEDEIINRSLDFKDAVAFNIYNSPRVVFPPPTEDEEPCYILDGVDARLEVPYVLWLIAQTAFPPSVDENTRVVQWMTMEYEVRLYNPSLPEMSTQNTNNYKVYQGTTVASVFQTTTANDPVVGNLSYFDLSGGGNETLIGELIVQQDMTDFVGQYLQFCSDLHGVVNLRAGVALYYKRQFDEHVGAPGVHFYPDLSSAYASTNEMCWYSGPTAGAMQDGTANLYLYDVDHTL
jgi:hypothetical protein